MAPASKKKKKPAVNPARGFATQSVASKSKSDTLDVDSSDATKDVTENPTGGTASPSKKEDVTTTTNPSKGQPEKELHELSPAELEKRLEETDLQNFVEKHSAKTQRDSARCVTKHQTECRLLRGQAQPLHTRYLLPDIHVMRLLQLASAEVSAGKHFVGDLVTRNVPVEDDLTVRIWTLQRTLLGLGFTKGHVEAALRYIVRFPPAIDTDVSVWGLEQCVDWLALNVDEVELPVFDAHTGKVATAAANQVKEDDTCTDFDDDSDRPRAKGQKSAPESIQHPPTPPEDDIEVSDLGSDLEPEELLSVYLRSKRKLYEARPDNPKAFSKAKKGKKKQPTQQATTLAGVTPGIVKLQGKIQCIESDVLFDQREADLQWENQRLLLAREQAERRRLNLSRPATPMSTNMTSEVQENQETTEGPVADVSASAPTEDVDDGDDGNDDAFGNLFASVGTGDSDDTVPRTAETDNGVTVVIQDFGQTKGVEPRRVLEEACRARDSDAKVRFKIVSSAAFASRHSVQIVWSRDQNAVFPLDSTHVDSIHKGRQAIFTMKTIACPDHQQSLAYISVFALLQIFSASSREEKAYLRLPPNWRNLWLELSDKAKAQIEASERDTVHALRSIIASPPDVESDDDIVLTRNFKKRNDDAAKRTGPLEDISDRVQAQKMEDIWAHKQSTPSFQRMLSIRKGLPMWLFREEALKTVERNQVTIICGETGCGKSTQMPSFILEREMSSGRTCKIYCTEPRRISAITLAQRVSEELGESRRDLGTVRSLVGYAIRLESLVCSATRLVYATTGIVLRMLESPDGFMDVTHVIIDEVHERSIETDFLLIILRSLMQQRPALKIVLMSATVDAQRFSKYFHDAPVLNVPGRTFPVQTRYLEDAIELTGHVPEDGPQELDASDNDDSEGLGKDTTVSSAKTTILTAYSKRTRGVLSNYNEYRTDYALIARLIESIVSSPELSRFGKAILVFLPGLAEIRRMADALNGSWIGPRYLIHSLHSSIASEDQTRAFALPPQGMGKIVLSTNIAETGVTIPDITAVIDTGKHKEMRFDERRQISRLLESFISRANAKQRRGRAGRVQEGLCFHLFTKSRHDEVMSDQQTPEMLRLSLQDLIMRVKICKLGDIQGTLADALDPPSAKNIRRAIDSLIEVGALTYGEQLTSLGHQLSKLPLDPYLGKLVLYGSLFRCLDVALTLAAILTSKSPFVTPIDARKQADLARLAFKKGDSDLLTEYNAYSAWRRIYTSGNMPEQAFCRKNLLSAQTLSNIEDLKAQLLSAVSDAGFLTLRPTDGNSADHSASNHSNTRSRRFASVPFSLDTNSSNTELVSTIIAWSLYPKLLTREGKGWRNLGTNQAINIHPTSIIRQAGFSASMANVQFLSFYSILQSSGARNYNANSLTPVAALTLLLQAGTATFHPIAHVVSIDGARLRFAIDASRQRTSNKGKEGSSINGQELVVETIGTWKTWVAIKFLRRRLEEVVSKRWKWPGQRLPARLESWMSVWEEIVVGWNRDDAR